MKIDFKRLLRTLVNGVIGYAVIHGLLSLSQSVTVRENKSTPVQSKWVVEGETGNPHTENLKQPNNVTQNIVKQPNASHAIELFEDEWWAQMASRQEERKKKLRWVCQSLYSLTPKDSTYLALHKTKLRPLIVNEKFHFIHSIVYKVGSSNFSRVIVQDVEGHQNVYKLYSHKALRWMPTFDERMVKELLDNYTKFMFARNPLSRILSGYRDKFVNHHNSWYSSLARRIIEKYRIGSTAENAGQNVTFTEFVSYLVDSKGNRQNPHWIPVYVRNMPCEIKFDIIGKLEEASDDIPYVLKKIGVWNVTDYGKRPPRKSTADKLLKEYYSKIPPQLLQDLYKVYEPDFRMFGYDMPLFM